MKFQKIVGFGDSWMWGDELMDPALKDHPDAHPVLIENTAYRESNCFLGRLGQHYNVPVENFGIAGGSLRSSIWTYLWWLENEPLEIHQCLVLVALTDSNRQTFYNPRHVSYANDPAWNRFVHSAWIHSGNTANGKDWQDFVKMFTVLSDCSELHRLSYIEAVTFFHGQKTATAGVLQFNSMRPPCRLGPDSLIWPSQGLAGLINQEPNRLSLLAPKGHPNEKGHEWIKTQLITEIDRAIIQHDHGHTQLSSR